MPSTDKLMKDITTSKFWMRTDGGYAPTGQHTRVAGLAKSVYTEEDFAAIDPRLPLVLAELSDNFTADIITSVLEYWQGPQLMLPKLDDEEIIVSLHYPVRYIHDIQLMKDTSMVQVKADIQKFRTTATGTEFPWGTYRKELLYEKTLIDTLLPNWETKSLAADALDLGLHERTLYITGDAATKLKKLDASMPCPTFE